MVGEGGGGGGGVGGMKDGKWEGKRRKQKGNGDVVWKAKRKSRGKKTRAWYHRFNFLTSKPQIVCNVD